MLGETAADLLPAERAVIREVLARDRPGPRLITIRATLGWRRVVVRDRWLESSVEDGEEQVRVHCHETIYPVTDGERSGPLYACCGTQLSERYDQLVACVSLLTSDEPSDRDTTTNPLRGWLIASKDGSVLTPSSKSPPGNVRVVATNDVLARGHLAYLVDEAARGVRNSEEDERETVRLVTSCLELLGTVTPATLVAAAIDTFDTIAMNLARTLDE